MLKRASGSFVDVTELLEKAKAGTTCYIFVTGGVVSSLAKAYQQRRWQPCWRRVV